MNERENTLKTFEEWFNGLARYRNNMPAKGTVAGAMVVLERLRQHYDLSLDGHLTAGGGQIAGASGSALQKILERYGETRRFLSEGGRTNRGLVGDIASLLEQMEAMKLDSMDEGERAATLDQLQLFLVDQVKRYHNLSRLEFDYDLQQSTWHLIHNLLEKAAEEGKAGPVAQHLVGAKLQLRFPEHPIENESFSTADVQLDRPGDFAVEGTVFHVTVAPQPSVYTKCRSNLMQGLRPYLIVPNKICEGTRQNAELTVPERITVTSIESFVSQNIEELSRFSTGTLPKELYQLLKLYNERVEAVERDQSIMIEIPSGLSD